MERKYEDSAQIAESEISVYEISRDSYANLLRQEMALEAQRAAVKDAAVTRIMGTLNAKTDRQHSASSAAEAVHTDEEYQALLLNLRNTVHAKNSAETKATAAFFRATLALTSMKVTAGIA